MVGTGVGKREPPWAEEIPGFGRTLERKKRKRTSERKEGKRLRREAARETYPAAAHSYTDCPLVSSELGSVCLPLETVLFTGSGGDRFPEGIPELTGRSLGWVQRPFFKFLLSQWDLVCQKFPGASWGFPQLRWVNVWYQSEIEVQTPIWQARIHSNEHSSVFFLNNRCGPPPEPQNLSAGFTFICQPSLSVS